LGAHDREMTEGREETIEGGVILRFPGDWVGPLEELVPFGPSADRESSAEAPDFWGEESAALQDAVEAADALETPEPRPPRRERLPLRRRPLPLRRWLLPAAAVAAAALFAVAAMLGRTPPSSPQVHVVPFAIASIPSLAPAPPAHKQQPARHRRAASHHLRHPKSARPATASTTTAVSAPPVTTPSSTYHPAPASSSTAGSSSQTGGAFTLGGP
jgi:hypothetical protein